MCVVLQRARSFHGCYLKNMNDVEDHGRSGMMSELAAERYRQVRETADGLFILVLVLHLSVNK